MPTPDRSVAGAPCWIELFSSDTDRAVAFYGELFGWTAEAGGPELGGYINLSKGDAKIAGCMANDGSQGIPDAWTIYLSTADIKAAADACKANGGTVYVEPMDVMDLGAMCVMGDPSGATIGAWEPGTHLGFDIVAEPGTPGWFELQTPDYAGAVEFYRTVFGWDVHSMSDTDELRYSTLLEGDAQCAGIMDASSFLPAGSPGEWSVYVSVTDADATLAKATELGGTVTIPAEDTPYGRLAQIADPTGARIKIVG